MIRVENGEAIPILLDFGLTKKIDERIRLAFARMLFSAAKMDYAGLLQAFDEMGLKVP